MAISLCLLIVLFQHVKVSSQQPAIFYPFGTANGDANIPKCDDCSSGPIPLSISLPLYGTFENSLYMNSNGAISFGTTANSFNPPALPVAGQTFLTAFWADVDTRGQYDGLIYFRETTDSTLLQRATTDVQQAFPSQTAFQATWLFIATWDQVGHWGQTSAFSTVKNSYQVVLISDGTLTFAMFNYGDILWTRGSRYGVAGHNVGDGVHSYSLPGSETPAIIDVELTTNVGVTGRWVFDVTGDDVIGDDIDPVASASCPASPVLMSDLQSTPSFTLDGTGSTDNAGPVTYSWTQDTGPTTVNPSAAATDTWTITNGDLLLPGDYSFTLTVTDGSSNTDTAVVTFTIVDGTPPVACANCPEECQTTSLLDQNPVITLDGTCSTDNTGSLTITWEQIDGCSSAALLDNGSGSWDITNGDLLKPGCYAFNVIGIDAADNEDTMTCTFKVNDECEESSEEDECECESGSYSFESTGSLSDESTGSLSDESTGSLWDESTGPHNYD